MELDPPDSDTGDRDRRRSGEDKKETVQKLIERYYRQLTVGCGRPAPGCDNPDCASFSAGHKLPPNDAAVQSIRCLKVSSFHVLWFSLTSLFADQSQALR